VSDNSNSQLDGDHAISDSNAVLDVDTSSQVPNNNIVSNCASFDANCSPVDCDSLMKKAYGATLIQSGSCSNTPWHRRWKTVVYHSGNHYVLPGGPTGRRFVDLLTEETQHLAVGNFPSERVLILGSVILQHDRMVCKSADICRLLDRHVIKPGIETGNETKRNKIKLCTCVRVNKVI